MKIDIGYFALAVLVMFGVTYIPRVLPFVIFKKRIKSLYIQSFLTYVPYAALAAMTFPYIFTSTGSAISAIVGLIVALVLAYFNRSLLTTALASVAAVFITEWVIGLIAGA